MSVESNAYVSGEDRVQTSQIKKRVTVETSASPNVPAFFFSICLVGVLLMMFGPFAFMWFGWYIAYAGGLTVALGLLSAGFLAKNISQNTRQGLVLGGALVIGLVIWFYQFLFNCSRIW